jgi:hypothetical protein
MNKNNIVFLFIAIEKFYEGMLATQNYSESIALHKKIDFFFQ